MVYSTLLYTRFGAVYGAGQYDSGVYNSSSSTVTPAPTPTPTPTPISSNSGTTATTTQDSSSSSQTGGLLANTGFDILLAVSFACLIIFAALLIRFWRRPKHSA